MGLSDKDTTILKASTDALFNLGWIFGQANGKSIHTYVEGGKQHDDQNCMFCRYYNEVRRNLNHIQSEVVKSSDESKIPKTDQEEYIDQLERELATLRGE